MTAAIIMDYDDDDLPAGYPNPWALFLESFRRERAPETRWRPTEQNRRWAKTFYSRARHDAEWVARRRAYYRARYAAGKDRKR